MTILSEQLAHYLESFLPERSTTLESMEAYAREEEFPIIGPMVGPVLEMFARLTRARRVFEYGSGFGYSAAWFARGMEEGGTIVCCEYKASNIERGKEYFRRLDMPVTVEWHQGEATEIIKSDTAPFDLILNDADKEHYPEVFHQAMRHLRTGGVLLTDNVYWSGKILEQPDPEDHATRGVLEFNRLAFQTPTVLSFMLPYRDGLMVSQKTRERIG